jgi:poly(3-hydroxybutyrate) depolymerase
LVRQASSYPGPFPKVSIWHGSADTVVNPVNAEEEILQWTNVHGIAANATGADIVKGAYRTFRDGSGGAIVEAYTIPGMNHVIQ